MQLVLILGAIAAVSFAVFCLVMAGARVALAKWDAYVVLRNYRQVEARNKRRDENMRRYGLAPFRGTKKLQEPLL